MKKETYHVGNMHCAMCVRTIEKVLQEQSGISTANVNLANNTVWIEYDETQIAFEDLQKLVEQQGYTLEKKNSLHTVSLVIEDMSCANCVASIEKASKAIVGVEKADVNLVNKTAYIIYDKEQTTITHIKEAIKKAGYHPEVKIEEQNQKSPAHKESLVLKRKLIIALIFTIPLLYISMGHMIGLWLPEFLHMGHYPLRFALAQLILTIPVMIAGYQFYTFGFKRLFLRKPNMDSLIAIGTSAAFLYGIYALVQIAQGNGEYANRLYFEIAAAIIAFILLGKYLEALSKGKTTDAIKKLLDLAPKTARLMMDGKEIIVDIEEVAVGNILRIRPGEKIPVDGVVVFGQSAIDESMITGESIPVDKSIGDQLIGASINKYGLIEMKATKVGKDTTLSQIVQMVESAQGSKAPIAKLADVISGVFVPIVLIISLLSGIAWWISGQSFVFSMTISIAVLVIACPCALGLATPTAIMVGTGKGAEYGVLIKSGEALEALHQVHTIVFDKTGTITEGKPQVTDIITFTNWKKDEVLALAASAEKASEHPLGQAIVDEATKNNIELFQVSHFLATPGMGLVATINEKEILIGNRKWMNTNNITKDNHDEGDTLANEGKTPMYVACNKEIIGIIAVADVIKKNSKKAIEELEKMGHKIIMLTGDNDKTATAIAKMSGIHHFISEVLPEEKANEIKKIQETDKFVAMVGDGINDAVALAQADVGIAIGSGTDVAIESADVVLMKNDLTDVVTAIKLSKKTIKNIKQNLFWAFAYNTLGIPIAAGILYAFGGPTLNPMFAALAMAFSSVSVVLNALRLKRFRP